MVCVLQRGHSGDGCDLASTLCKYDLREGDLFVLSWARVRRVRLGSISSELLMCGGGVRSILLLPLLLNLLQREEPLIHVLHDQPSELVGILMLLEEDWKIPAVSGCKQHGQ